jgi:hypothetical protein
MNTFIKCVKIESSFTEDDLIIPTKGEISLEINNEIATLKIRFKSKKNIYDSEEDMKTIERQVKAKENKYRSVNCFSFRFLKEITLSMMINLKLFYFL